MNFKKWVKSIQTAGYNVVHTVRGSQQHIGPLILEKNQIYILARAGSFLSVRFNYKLGYKPCDR